MDDFDVYGWDLPGRAPNFPEPRTVDFNRYLANTTELKFGDKPECILKIHTSGSDQQNSTEKLHLIYATSGHCLVQLSSV